MGLVSSADWDGEEMRGNGRNGDGSDGWTVVRSSDQAPFLSQSV